MPYRRLPNTDNSRLKAMEKALSVADKKAPYDLAYSITSLQKLKYFYPSFAQEIKQNKDIFNRQTDSSKSYQDALKKARMYISHFIQVLNFAILRGEIKTDSRKYFDLEEFEKKLPLLNTESDILLWGEKLIKGEQQRMAEGLTPVTNPTIARVKIHYENFVRLHKQHKKHQESHSRSLQKISELRDTADEIILNIWNEVEQSYNNLQPELKRLEASKYGVVYVFRKNEKMPFKNINLQQMANFIKEE